MKYISASLKINWLWWARPTTLSIVYVCLVQEDMHSSMKGCDASCSVTDGRWRDKGRWILTKVKSKRQLKMINRYVRGGIYRDWWKRKEKENTEISLSKLLYWLTQIYYNHLQKVSIIEWNMGSWLLKATITTMITTLFLHWLKI